MPDYLSVSAGDCRGLMRPEEVTHMAHCQRNLLLGGLPGIEAHRAFGARCTVSIRRMGAPGRRLAGPGAAGLQERTKSRVTV